MTKLLLSFLISEVIILLAVRTDKAIKQCFCEITFQGLSREIHTFPPDPHASRLSLLGQADETCHETVDKDAYDALRGPQAVNT